MSIDINSLTAHAAQLNIPLDAERAGKMIRYCELMLDKNRVLNLTAITEPDEAEVKHIVDSLAAAKQNEMRGRVADVGTGGGFPGSVIAAYKPDCSVVMIDSTRKKLDFVAEALKASGIENASVLHGRAEEIARGERRESFDCVVARAVANLAALAEYCMPLVAVGGYFIAMKGENNELDIGMNAVKTLGGRVNRVERFSLPDGSSRTLVIVEKISQTPTKYPRQSKKITEKPL